MKDFAAINDKEVRRIVVFLSKTFNRDIIEDYTQTFYLNALKSDLLGKFEWDRPDTEASFSSYVFRAIANSVSSSKRSDKRHYNDKHVSTVGEAGESQDVYEVMHFSHDTSAVGKSGGTTSRAGMRVENRCRYSSITLDNEEKFFQQLGEFEKTIQADSSLSEKTRGLYLNYLSLSSEGVSASKVAELHEVAPAYITHVRRVLRGRFNKLIESTVIHNLDELLA
jgi:hypothetical protein